MPFFAKATNSLQTFGFSRSAGGLPPIGAPYFFSGDNVDMSYYPTSTTVDTSGNIYTLGYSNSPAMNASGYQSTVVQKVDSSGNLLWRNYLAGSNVASPGNHTKSIAVDSSGNVYICGYFTVGSQYGWIAKYNSTGTIQWQKSIQGSYNTYGNNILVDSSGNIYVAGNTLYSISCNLYNSFWIAKFNSSGTVIWQKFKGINVSGAPSDSNIVDMQFDSSGNIIVLSNAASYNIGLFKIQASDGSTLTYSGKQYPFLPSTQYSFPQGMTLDGSDNVYVSGLVAAYWNPYCCSPSTGYYGYIIKMNSSFGIQSTYTIASTDGYYKVNTTRVVYDGIDSIYLNSEGSAGTGSNALLFKLATSDLSVSRKEKFQTQTSGTPGQPTAINNYAKYSVDRSGNIYGSYSVGVPPGYQLYTSKLPKDNSKLGTYSIVVSGVTTWSLFYQSTTAYTFTSQSAPAAHSSTSVTADTSLTINNAGLTSGAVSSLSLTYGPSRGVVVI